MLVVNRNEVERLYTMADAFEAVREAAVAWTSGRSSVPPRTALVAAESGIETLVMSGVVDGTYSGAKIWYAGPGGGPLPVSSALIVLLDPILGEVLLDGSVITDLRTGAMTGLAAQALAPPETRTAAILGAGIQARTQALALAHALPGLREIRISSRRAETRRAFVDQLIAELAAEHPRIEVVSADEAETACRGSQVVVAATTARQPVVADSWLEPDALVCSVGSHDPEAAELEFDTVRRAAVVAVDTKRGGVGGAGDIGRVIDAGELALQDVHELGDILVSSEDRFTAIRGLRVLKTVGFASADLVSARRIARAASAAGVGSRLEIH